MSDEPVLVNKLARMRDVFGKSTHGRPIPNATQAPVPQAVPPTQEIEPETQRSPISGLVVVSGFRFNGSQLAPPWNLPEEQIFNWLLTSPIEMLEERGVANSNGVFWGWMRAANGDLKAVLVRFAGVGRAAAVDLYGTEYVLDSELDLVSREVAAYEVVKALGAEDLALPVCIRDLNTVALVSDAVRDDIAKILRVTPDTVDERLTPTATVQLAPPAMINFAEHWGDLGVTTADRWEAASDQLRYSIYRAYFSDFILGVADRSYSSFGYNPDTDKVVMSDQSISFPHVGLSTEKYMQMRLKGWSGVAIDADRIINSLPPSSYEFIDIFINLNEKHVDEAVWTAKQISERMTDEMASRLAFCLIEHDVPVECVSGVLLRLAYLAFAAGSVIKRPIEFIRNLCTPIRAGMEITDPKISNAIDYVNDVMSSATGEPFEMLEVLMQPVDDVEFKM